MSKPTITYEQAVHILDRAASLAPLTRQQHIEVQMATEVLEQFGREMKQPAKEENPSG